MDSNFGSYLNRLRTDQGLSLGKLAERAQVNKSTLSRWEAGTAQPRLPELEAVLQAVGASADQQQQAFHRLSSTRSIRHARKGMDRTSPFADEGELVFPSGGELLRAMRLRRGLSLETMAKRVGVSPTAASYWERCETWPDEDRLERLLDLLAEAPEERNALKTRSLALHPSPESPGSLEETELRFLHLRDRVSRGERSLLDLRFLALESELWPLLGREPTARELLGRVYAWHARGLSWWGRVRETPRYANAALVLLEGGSRFEADWLEAVKVTTLYDNYGRKKVSHQKGMDAWMYWLPQARTPAAKARMQREIAACSSLAGEHDAAMKLSLQALTTAERLEDEALHSAVRSTRASALLRYGRPYEAHQSIPDRFPAHPVDHQFDLMRNVHIYQALGDKKALEENIKRAHVLLDTYGVGGPLLEEVYRK